MENIAIVSAIISAELKGMHLTRAVLVGTSGFLLNFTGGEDRSSSWSLSGIAVDWDIYLEKALLLGQDGGDFDISALVGFASPLTINNFKLDGTGRIQILLTGGYYIRVVIPNTDDETAWILSHNDRWLIAWDIKNGLAFESMIDPSRGKT